MIKVPAGEWSKYQITKIDRRRTSKQVHSPASQGAWYCYKANPPADLSEINTSEAGLTPWYQTDTLDLQSTVIKDPSLSVQIQYTNCFFFFLFLWRTLILRVSHNFYQKMFKSNSLHSFHSNRNNPAQLHTDQYDFCDSTWKYCYMKNTELKLP